MSKPPPGPSGNPLPGRRTRRARGEVMPKKRAPENRAISTAVESPLPSTAASADSSFGFVKTISAGFFSTNGTRTFAKGGALDALSGFQAKLVQCPLHHLNCVSCGILGHSLYLSEPQFSHL